MSVQTAVSRPAGKSVGAAVLGLLATLVAFLLVLMTFLVAPLALFAIAALTYLVLRPRARSQANAPRVTSSTTTPDTALHGFGTGAP